MPLLHKSEFWGALHAPLKSHATEALVRWGANVGADI